MEPSQRHDHAPSEAVRVEPRVMAVLTCLARHVGEVVTRDEFSTEVWGGRVVSDEALSRCISLLRQVLDDDSREPRFIRTIARIGYTLVPTPVPLASSGVDAPARPLPHSGTVLPVPTQPVTDRRRAAHPLDDKVLSGRSRHDALAAVGCYRLVAALAFVYFAREMRRGPDARRRHRRDAAAGTAI